MSSAHCAIGYCKGRGDNGIALPVRQSVLSRSETIASGAASVQSTLVATQVEIDRGAVWFVTAIDTNILVTCGSDPTAVATNAHFVLAGQTLELGMTAVGEKLAVKDA